MPKRSFTITAAALCGGAMMLTGCGQAAQPQMMSTTAQSGTPEQHDAAASACTGEDFSIFMRPQPNDPGSFLLELQNRSDKSCQVGGWTHLVPSGAKGQRIDVPTEQVETPTPPNDDLRLGPGGTAYSGVRAELGDPPIVAVGFDTTLSNMTGKVPTEVEKPEGQGARIPVTHLQIGTLQPTPEGVLF